MAIKKYPYTPHTANCNWCNKEYLKKYKGRDKCDSCDAARHRKKNYGHCLNFPEWEDKFNKIHNCQMCNKPFGDRNLDKKAVDHLGDMIRGIICKECNTALGFLRENVTIAEAAVLYLKDTISKEVSHD